MSVAVGLWSRAFVPGKPETVIPSADLRITNAALGDDLVDEKGRTVLKMTFEKIQVDEDEDEDEAEAEAEGNKDKESTSSTFVCSLTAGKTEQAVLDITLMDETEYIFEVVGKNTVYLTGNYIYQNNDQPPYDDDSDTEGLAAMGYDDEDAYDLREVSSDVEMHPDDLDGVESDDEGRFEEVKEEAPKSKKRARESDVAEGKPAPKAEKKNKKQKVEAAQRDKDEKTEKTDNVDKKDKKDKKGQADKTEAVTRELAGGLKIRDAKIGTGPGAKKGQRIEMRYIGKLANGKVFDSNTKGQPFKFVLGAGEVIKGWDQGLTGIQVGGERVLTIPPALGYGKKGSAPIPPNAVLTFEVKCIGIK